MSLGFERGAAYNRRKDIHGRFGGQQQSGIITPAQHNVIFIVSGKRGLEFGYEDKHHADGLLEYFGEGQVGDMTMTGGNRAIAEHVQNGKQLLYFTKSYPDRQVTFVDEYVCQGWHTKRTPDINGALRNAIVFELRPLDSVVETVEAATPPKADVDLDTLRALAYAAAKANVSSSTKKRTVYERAADVRDYVLARASGDCEGCGSPAPFIRKSGAPYLEPHHIRRVSDGGPDDPRHVIALCPTCHRRVHFGSDGTNLNAVLAGKMSSIELD